MLQTAGVGVCLCTVCGFYRAACNADAV